MPSRSSAATRAASWVRVRVISRRLRAARAGGALLDGLAVRADLHDALHEHARGVDVLRVEFAGFDEFLDLGDRDPPGRGAQRVEVARRRVRSSGCRAGRRAPRAPARSRRRSPSSST